MAAFVRMLRHVLVCRNYGVTLHGAWRIHAGIRKGGGSGTDEAADFIPNGSPFRFSGPQARNGSAAGLYAQRIGDLDVYFRFVEPSHGSPATGDKTLDGGRRGVPANVQRLTRDQQAHIAVVQCDDEVYLRTTVEKHAAKYPVIGAIATNAEENPVTYDRFRFALATSLDTEKCGYVPTELLDIESTKQRMECMCRVSPPAPLLATVKNALTIISTDAESAIPEFTNRIEGRIEHLWKKYSNECKATGNKNLSRSGSRGSLINGKGQKNAAAPRPTPNFNQPSTRNSYASVDERVMCHSPVVERQTSCASLYEMRPRDTGRPPLPVVPVPASEARDAERPPLSVVPVPASEERDAERPQLSVVVPASEARDAERPPLPVTARVAEWQKLPAPTRSNTLSSWGRSRAAREEKLPVEGAPVKRRTSLLHRLRSFRGTSEPANKAPQPSGITLSAQGEAPAVGPQSRREGWVKFRSPGPRDLGRDTPGAGHAGRPFPGADHPVRASDDGHGRGGGDILGGPGCGFRARRYRPRRYARRRGVRRFGGAAKGGRRAAAREPALAHGKGGVGVISLARSTAREKRGAGEEVGGDAQGGPRQTHGVVELRGARVLVRVPMKE
ncbi:hypothetical protein BDK51DRAFT_41143 [Blyttiomyces helicus]|uniref:Uncharacterized protein n=1 Tax=Blyttiomyces helicus TaxID=388810 RepID=A0A4P9WIB6_9FUNG|nr:hypothetical protein BDK51DRAFT_41143 [Blyttiomyces helicus]|eukprot:RKO92514.1 hypothetical protein BDK51DRAFT_41143 [Blyttiomyces helicus]